MTLCLYLLSTKYLNNPNDIAAPSLSIYIFSILFPVFIEYPPVSIVTPLPTKHIVFLHLGGLYSNTTKQGLLLEEPPTASISRNPIFLISLWLYLFTLTYFVL